MLDEIVFRWHQLSLWWYLYSDDWWAYKFIVAYPFSCGLLIGVLSGYYAEPFMMFCEKHAGRRAMRRRIRRRMMERDEDGHLPDR